MTDDMIDTHALRRLQVEQFPHHYDIQARFADLDPNDHINNIAVAEMFSEGRNAFIRHMFSHVERPAGFRFVVGQVAVRYIVEARWPGTFTIGTGVIAIGTRSLRLGQGFFMSGELRMIAEAVLVAPAKTPMTGAARVFLNAQLLAARLLPRQLN